MQKTNLIIIGNGFDRQCKLNSSYNHFFIDRKENVFKSFYSVFNTFKNSDYLDLRENNGYISSRELSDKLKYNFAVNLKNINDSRNSELNIWDFIFTFCFQDYDNENDIKWIDIEEYINKFIMNSETLNKLDSINLYKVYINIDSMIIDLSNLRLFKIISFIKRIYSEESIDKEFLKSKNQLLKAHESKDLIDFNRFLFLELNRFEENFRKYLFLIQEKNFIEYNVLATELYSKIIGKDHVNKNYYMNFNYTLPTAKIANINGINIHGFVGDSVDDERNEVIFGFDQSNINFDKTNYMFTKTSRKLHHRCSLIEQNLPTKKEVNRIKFFGHSLGEGDYSYFYSIFDYYDIYNNDIEIEFIYCFYKGKEPDEIRFDLQSNIAKLFHSYGDAMYKDGHGKNLIHKLLLEKRLSLRLIDSFY